MPKFRIRLKLQGLELEIDGEREDIPALGAAVRQQFAGLIKPAELTLDHKQLSGAPNGDEQEDENKSKGRSRRRNIQRGGQDGPTAPLEFRHDAAKYGNPVQSWTLVEKCIWLLYVVKNVLETKEVSAPQLAATFNQYFKGSGKVHPPHVSRDLGRAKLQNPASVGEDKGLFFLTDEGDKVAKNLIQGVLQTS
jgi:hypothetical protein